MLAPNFFPNQKYMQENELTNTYYQRMMWSPNRRPLMAPDYNSHVSNGFGMADKLAVSNH